MRLSQESICIIGGALALGALIVWKYHMPQISGVSPAAPVPDPVTSETAAPYYTQYNTNDVSATYALPPPLAAAMPAQSMGIAGAISGVARMMGCKSCGNGA
jgi:hypothetical protein